MEIIVNYKSFRCGRGILAVLSGLASLVLLAWLISNSYRGIDFTDESFYLVLMKNPYLYDWGVSQFGFFYHPIYQLVGGEVAKLRQFNILSIFFLSWCLVALFLRGSKEEDASLGFIKLVVAAGLASVSLVFFSSWIATPSYNSLAFKGLLIASIGILILKKNKDDARGVPWGGVWIGVGGWMAFMAKPSAAVMLAGAVLICLILTGRFSIKVLLSSLSSAVILLMVSIIFIDGSIFDFIKRLQTGLVFGSYLGGGHTLEQILRLDDFFLVERAKDAIFFFFLACGGVTLLLCQGKSVGELISILFSLACCTIIFLLAIEDIVLVAGFGFFQGFIFFGVIFFFAFLGFFEIFSGRGGKNILEKVGFMCFFLFLPYAYAFGSNGNYWWVGGFVAFFWILGGFVLAPGFYSGKGWHLALPVVLVAQLIAAILIQTGMEQPYRQNQPLRLNDKEVEFGEKGSRLVLSTGYAEYLESIKKNIKEVGFLPGTPVLDLTGQSPGVLHAMRALSIGQPWVIGGYPGSLKLAIESLNLVSCEKNAEAWLLMELKGPRSIEVDAIRSQGGQFPEGYEQVASWVTAEGAGGYSQKREQVLYKPIEKQQMLMNCKNIRSE